MPAEWPAVKCVRSGREMLEDRVDEYAMTPRDTVGQKVKNASVISIANDPVEFERSGLSSKGVFAYK